MAVKTTKILSTVSLDDVTIEEDSTSQKVQVKDLGVNYDKIETDLQDLVNTVSMLIEVKEPGFYVVDGDLNIGFAVQNPQDFGLGLANND